MRFIISLFFFFVSVAAISQKTEDNGLSDLTFGERLFFGGGLGLTFGNITYIEVSPQVGYKFTPKFGAGIGATYIYYGIRDLDYSTSIYGGSVFARYNILQWLLAYSEFQVLNVDTYISREPDGGIGRVNVPIWLLGVGWSSPPGSGLGAQLLLLWDVIGDINSPYTNPVIRGGISIGF